jgi:hypothetical protein
MSLIKNKSVEFLVHILQAEHNESLADYLIGIDPYHE